MQTLALRMRQHNSTALALAKFLEDHDKVAHVYYPGLPSHPQHERAARLFEGFGGMLSIELKGGLDAVTDLIDRLRLPLYAPSLGGVKSLMTRPAISSHAGLTPEEREIAGIRDSLLRISVGIEHVDDLIADFKHALH